MKIVVMKECSEGNGEVGSMWVETAFFDDITPLREVIKWADSLLGYGGVNQSGAGKHGRLMLSVADEPTEKDGKP